MTWGNSGNQVMHVPVLVEPVANNGFRAKTAGSSPVSAVGATPEEALQNLRAEMSRQLADGKQLQSVDAGVVNPWLALAGMHDPNDQLIREWKQEMAAYRQEVEDDPDRP
jgi:hypothetical protein